MAWGYATPLMIEAALENRVFDVLAGTGKTLDEVVSETGASRRGLRALLDALLALTLLEKDGDHYKLAHDVDAFLVSGKASFFGGMLQHTTRQILTSWLQLSEVVRTGKPSTAVNREDQGGLFFHDFVESLFPMSYPAAQALADALIPADGAAPIRILDLATGSGVWSVGLAQKNPHVEATCVDWPEVIPVTRAISDRFGLADRFRFVEGDIQDVDFGSGYQVATLGHILHSEGEARSRRLLKKVYSALAPGGTIAIAEMIPDADRSGPPFALIFGVNMLVNTEEGDVFSFEQIRSWLEEIGFVNVRTLEVPAPSPLVLADRPS